ncbi:hypothetical protein Q0Z83_066260 [Actinoplanes sichuanensis]|uniref:Uncharacterized protein n=1 Tax=Actinoplanes sichuanensis TaxID=512349 RepID=A0ABW4AMW8_9ACTN|nr:hypothetical protein [Actinoplanes sichuanensis]BEL08435.1 hypothetical protein Q0Z83_066260 [Actinoplanes sichuanensis]
MGAFVSTKMWRSTLVAFPALSTTVHRYQDACLVVTGKLYGAVVSRPRNLPSTDNST